MRCVSVDDERYFLTGTPIGHEIVIPEILRGPSVVHYCLGRPLVVVPTLNPAEIAASVGRLTNLCLKGIEDGARVRIVGDAASEFTVYTVLSLTLTRLRKLGLSLSVCGSPRDSAEAPPRPKTSVAALLGSDVYSSLDAWGELKPGQVIVLAEYSDNATGAPDMVIQSLHASASEFIQPHADLIRELWEKNKGNRIGGALLRCAVGLDVPADFFAPGEVPASFVSARTPDDQTTEWSTIGGSWIVRQVLREFISKFETEHR